MSRAWWFSGNEAAWSPSDMAGLEMWFDAGTQTTGVADGTALAQWDDLSGNARHLVQATGSLQPTAQTGAGDLINGRGVIDFDGTDDALAAVFTAIPQPTTIFVVASADVDSNNRFYVDGGAGGTGRQAIYWRVSDQLAFFGGSTEVDATAIDVPAVTSMHILEAVFDGASSALYVDGTARGTGNPGNHSLIGITVGNSSSLGGPWDGQMGTILVYSGALSSPNRDIVRAYLETRWGI